MTVADFFLAGVFGKSAPATKGRKRKNGRTGSGREVASSTGTVHIVPNGRTALCGTRLTATATARIGAKRCGRCFG